MVLGWVWVIDYKDPTPLGSHNLAQPRMTFFDAFFVVFFGTNFKPILGRFCPQDGSKNGPKIDQKSIKKSIHFLNAFWIDF